MRRPRVRLADLTRLDERIAAHLDGIAAAGSDGAALVKQALFERPGVGEVFVATIQAIETHDGAALDQLLAITQTLFPARAGLLSAFGWVSASHLRGIVKALLVASDPWPREAGLAACAMHRVDPGTALDDALRYSDAAVRARALRVAARLGRRDLLGACRDALADPDPICARAAALSAVLLGDRSDALSMLERIALDAPTEPAPWRLLLAAVAPRHAHSILATVAQDPNLVRTAIQGIAIAGNPHYVPWLITRMGDLALARLAGDAFTCITGAELGPLHLERKPAPDERPPSVDDDDHHDNAIDIDSANDEIVPIDEDDDLPWPDADKVAEWWHANAARFAPGQRYLLGHVPTPAVCLDVIRDGTQHQRRAAADCLTLLVSGTPLFNTSAPAWRQKQLLDRLA